MAHSAHGSQPRVGMINQQLRVPGAQLSLAMNRAPETGFINRAEKKTASWLVLYTPALALSLLNEFFTSELVMLLLMNER